MASPTKHENSMFRNFCRPYRCFGGSNHHSEKKKTVWFRCKSIDIHKSTDETTKASSVKSEEQTNAYDNRHESKSHKGNEVCNNDGNHNSFRNNSRSSGPSLFRRPSHTSRTASQAPSMLSGNLGNTVDTQKSNYTGPLKKTSWSHNLETKNQGNTMAQSGPLLGTVNRKENKAPTIMYTKSSGLVQLLVIEESLECSLEELCFGCVKRIAVSRAVITNNRQIVEEEDTLSIKVKPGWTKGTKITFEGTKDEEKGTHSCDVIFVITEKKHELYRREGLDLELTVRISLLEALTGCIISVLLLGGDIMSLMLDEIIVPGYKKIIMGQGMHNSKGHRGNLKVKFLVEFPEKLTADQKSDIAAILQDSC